MNGGSASTTFAEVVHGWSQKWAEPLEDPLPKPKRRLFALCGAAPWIVYNFGPEWMSVLAAYDDAFLVAAAMLALIAIQGGLAWWFAWLIGYQERKCSPTRLFLEGLLLPGVAAGLLTGVPFFSGGAP